MTLLALRFDAGNEDEESTKRTAARDGEGFGDGRLGDGHREKPPSAEEYVTNGRKIQMGSGKPADRQRYLFSTGAFVFISARS